MPKIGPKNGKRIAIVGGGPASLAVARDLAPIGYHCTVFDADPKAGGMMRSQIPKFRLPDSVIDEETDYILNLGIDFKGGHRIESLKKLLTENYDAIFVGSARRAGANSSFPAARKPPRTSISASTGSPASRSATPKRSANASSCSAAAIPRWIAAAPTPARRRGRQGHRAFRLRGNEGLAVGKGRRHPRGHSDPQLLGPGRLRARQRQAHRRHLPEGEGRI